MAVSGYIMQIQPFSVNDGNGIRTTIFFAGCPLRCKWCANPEGFEQEPLIGWYHKKCIGCGTCMHICPNHIGMNLNSDRGRCSACGACVRQCPTKARTQFVSVMTGDEILMQLHKHAIFYQYSGGGITFSGGEATAQPELLQYLSSAIYDMGLSMALETCGYFNYNTVKSTLSRMDCIFIDLKILDDSRHRYYTGVSNALILKNMKKLADIPADIVVRIPIICGVNDDETNIRQSARYVHTHIPKAKMELLPYHRFGLSKYEALGIPYEHTEFQSPTHKQLEQLKTIILEESVQIADYT